MDLEGKVSALKDFASFGSRSKNGSSSSGTTQNGQSSNSSSANGWGNWFAKGEKDPILPSLVCCLSNRVFKIVAREFVCVYMCQLDASVWKSLY